MDPENEATATFMGQNVQLTGPDNWTHAPLTLFSLILGRLSLAITVGGLKCFIHREVGQKSPLHILRPPFYVNERDFVS